MPLIDNEPSTLARASRLALQHEDQPGIRYKLDPTAEQASLM
jgi:hypothetical protein